MQDWMKTAASNAAEAAPIAALLTIPNKIKNRTVHVDGDMMAYWASGKDGTDIASSRRSAVWKLDAFRDLSGASSGVVHLTHPASTKGDRYLAATVKPYQGQRHSSKPRNWGFLRDFLEGAPAGMRSKMWTTREADDGFGLVTAHAIHTGQPLAVIATKDKDMRMLPGIHMDWDTHHLTEIAPGTFRYVCDRTGLVYGHAWFWQQMLMGDTVDNIPGLPMLNGKRVGKVTAEKLLKNCDTNGQAFDVVQACYEMEYADEWADRLVEQACLLWMRVDAAAAVDNFMMVCVRGGALLAAVERMKQRIKEKYAEAKSFGGCDLPRD